MEETEPQTSEKATGIFADDAADRSASVLLPGVVAPHKREDQPKRSLRRWLEARLDAISNGELDATAFLSDWWSEFQPAVLSVEQTDTLALREEVAERCAWMLFPTAEVARPFPTAEVVRPLLVGSGLAVHTGGAEGVDGVGGAADVSVLSPFESALTL